MKRLFMGSVLSAGIKISSAGLTFIMFMFLARALGPVEYGRFATMFAAGAVGAVVVLFGQHMYSMKTLSVLADDPSKGAVRRAFVWRTYLILAVFTLLSLAAVALIDWLAGAAGFSLDMTLLYGAFALVVAFALSDLVSHQYRAFGSIGWALLPRDVIWRGVVVVLCVISGLASFLFVDALQTVAIISGLLLALVAVQICFLFIGFKTQFQFDKSQPVQEPVKFQWNVITWMWIASLGMMGGNLNVATASFFLPPEAIGGYFAAQKTSQLLQMPILAIGIVAAPTFARLYAKDDFDGLRSVCKKFAILLALPLLIGTLIILAFGPQLLSLFDESFVSATAALTILAFSQLIVALGGPTRQLMLMADGEKYVVRYTLGTEILGIALVPLLIPLFGLIGAAIAIFVTRILFTTLSVVWCRRNLGVDTSILSLLPGKPKTS